MLKINCKKLIPTCFISVITASYIFSDLVAQVTDFKS